MLFTVLQLIAHASTADGYTADLPLPLPIRVEDENDNYPVFTEAIYNFEVPESSRIGKTTFRSKMCYVKCLYTLFERLSFYSKPDHPEMTLDQQLLTRIHLILSNRINV